MNIIKIIQIKLKSYKINKVIKNNNNTKITWKQAIQEIMKEIKL